MNEDKAGLIVNAIGVAVMELIGERVPITRDNLIDKLEHNRRRDRECDRGMGCYGMQLRWCGELK
jgi:hypothetical protein